MGPADSFSGHGIGAQSHMSAHLHTLSTGSGGMGSGGGLGSGPRGMLGGSLTPHALAAIAATNSALSPNVVSSESRTQQLATGLYSCLDLFHARGGGGTHSSLRSSAPRPAHAAELPGISGRSAALSPLAGTPDGDYQLHDDTRDVEAPLVNTDGNYELRAVVGSMGSGPTAITQHRATGAACAAAVLEATGTV